MKGSRRPGGGFHVGPKKPIVAICDTKMISSTGTMRAQRMRGLPSTFSTQFFGFGGRAGADVGGLSGDELFGGELSKGNVGIDLIRRSGASISWKAPR